MKKFSRFLSAILSVIMILGLVPLGQISVVAADVPALSLNLVSETDTEVKVSINLDSGSFVAADFGLKLNSKNLTCTQIIESDELDNFITTTKRTNNNAVVSAYYKDTLKCSIATTTPFASSDPIFVYTFKKAAKTKTVKADLSLYVSSFKDGKGYIVTPTIANNLRVSAAPLTAPTVKGSNVASTGKNKLTWNAVSGAKSYKVYRATSKTGSFSLMKTTTSTSYINTSATAGKTYYYKVCAVEADGSLGNYSAVVTRTCDYARPTAEITGVSSSGKNKVTWEAVDGATSYKVYRSTSKDGTYNLMKTTTSLSYVNTSAVAGTKYYYKVKACGTKSAADSAYSSYVVRTAHYARPVVSISGDAATGKNKLSWKAIDGATAYEVYISTSKDGTYTLAATVKTTDYTHTSAAAGAKYYYKVKAIGANSTATSAFSSYKCRTCDLARPVVTANVNSKGQPKLSWGAVSGAVSYRVYRSTSADGTYTLMKTTTSTSYTNTTAVSGTTYYYKVKAVASTSVADSAYSPVLSVKAK